MALCAQAHWPETFMAAITYHISGRLKKLCGRDRQ